MDNMITAGYDAILVNWTDFKYYDQQIMKAYKAGIPVQGIACGNMQPGVISHGIAPSMPFGALSARVQGNFDVDPTFSNTEEWWLSIPEEARPLKDQPYYHVLAENEKSTYIAYVSEQNLLPDESGEPCRHPLVSEIFGRLRDGLYELRRHQPH